MRLVKKRKAQGLSMNVIIIAAIALLVLVVLAVIFIGRMGKTVSDIDACKGQCISGSSDVDCKKTLGEYYKKTSDTCIDSTTSKKDATKICCVGIQG